MANNWREIWDSSGGKAPSHWDFYSIESLLKSSKSISVGVMYPGGSTEFGIPLIRVSDVKDGQVINKPDYLISNEVDQEYQRTRLDGSELLITLVGNPGDCVVVSDRMKGWNVARALAVVRLADTSIRDWLRYVLLSPPAKHQIDSRLNTTVQRTLNLKDIREIGVPVPSKKERDYITNILNTLDQKIELNRQMNDTLEAMAQALFKSWFVDFDPVIDNALAAGNPIPDELSERAEQRKAVQHDDNQAVRALFPDEFVLTEEMGWIPKGWQVEELEKRIDVLNGFAFKSQDYVESGIFVLRTKNFNSQQVVELLTDDVYLPFDFEKIFSKYLCEPFDYHLIMVGASVGNRGLIEPHQLPALRNQNMWCFRPKLNSKVSRSYVKYMLDHITPQKLGLASGSAREFFRKGDFQSSYICFSSDSVLNKFDEVAFSYLKKQAENNSEIFILNKLRDTLLPKLLSGELRIPDAAALVEDI